MVIRFPAVLKDDSGTIIEIGTAELAPQPNTLQFRGGFIPLQKIGTVMELVRTLYGKDEESFRGEVFRSSRNLISITSIESYRMMYINETFSSNTRFEARPFFFKSNRFIKNRRTKTYDVEATVYHISAHKIKFLSIDPIKEGDMLLLDTDSPVRLEGVLLEVGEVVDFDGVSDIYICNIAEISESSLQALKEYIDALDPGEDDLPEEN